MIAAKHIGLLVWLVLGTAWSGWAQLSRFAALQPQPAVQHGMPGKVADWAGASQPDHTPWVVYSDRAKNPTYQQPDLSLRFKQMQFREAFYVLDERQGFLKLVRYDPALGPGRRLSKNRKKAVYYGWAPKSRFIVSNRVPLDSAKASPTLYCAALANSRMLRDSANALRHDSLQVAASPDLTGTSIGKVKLYDLVYIYKRSDSGQSVLLGKTDWFAPDSAINQLIGWAPLAAVQSVGQGQFLEQRGKGTSIKSTKLYSSSQQALLKDSTPLLPPQAFPTVAWSSTKVRLPILEGEVLATDHPGWQLGLLNEILAGKDTVYTVNGKPLTAAQAADYGTRSRVFNIMYVVEASEEMGQFWGKLVNSMQTTISRWPITPEFEQLRVGAVFYHQASALPAIPLATQPKSFINRFIRHNPKESSTIPSEGNSLLGGVEQALGMLKSHKSENNIVIVVGINGDVTSKSQPAGMSKLNKLLQATEVRFLSFQVQAKTPLDLVTNNFVLQSQLLLNQSASLGSVMKQQRLVSPELLLADAAVVLGPGSSPQNVYQLAFPKQSMVPGWVLFPAKNNQLPFNLLQATTDSLLAQMRFDVRQTQAAMEHAFLVMLPVAGRIHPQVSQTLAAQGQQLVPVPTPALVALRHYPFYSSAYTRPRDSLAAFRQVRCLTPDTYAVIGQWLDRLASDGLDPLQARDRERLASNFKQLRAASGRASADSTTLAQVLSELVGLPVRHPVLKRLRLSSLTSPNNLSAGNLQQLLTLLRMQRNAYRLVPTTPDGYFISNGQTYYWLREDLFK
jgi:hypothetical protein